MARATFQKRTRRAVCRPCVVEISIVDRIAIPSARWRGARAVTIATTTRPRRRNRPFPSFFPCLFTLFFLATLLLFPFLAFLAIWPDSFIIIARTHRAKAPLLRFAEVLLSNRLSESHGRVRLTEEIILWRTWRDCKTAPSHPSAFRGACSKSHAFRDGPVESQSLTASSPVSAAVRARAPAAPIRMRSGPSCAPSARHSLDVGATLPRR